MASRATHSSGFNAAVVTGSSAESPSCASESVSSADAGKEPCGATAAETRRVSVVRKHQVAPHPFDPAPPFHAHFPGRRGLARVAARPVLKQERSTHARLLKNLLHKLEMDGDKYDRLVLEHSRQSVVIQQLADTDVLAAVPLWERLNFAALFVQAALARRHIPAVNWKSPLGRRLYVLQQSRWYVAAMVLTAAAYLVVAHWEAVNPAHTRIMGDRPPAVAILELICTAALVAQLCVAGIASGWREFARGGSDNIINVAATAVVVADVVVNVCLSWSKPLCFRFSMPLRPVFLCLFSRSVRKVVLAVLQTLPSLADLAMIIVLTVMLFACVGYAVFGPGEGVYAYDEHGSLGSVGFPSLTGSVVQLLVLFTSSDIPRAYAPAFTHSLPYAAPYFGAFLMLSAFCLLPLVAAVVFASYKSGHGMQLLAGKRSERVALIAAFTCMLSESDDTAELSFPAFLKLLERVRPGISTVDAHSLFAQVDTDSSNRLEAPEFLKLCDMLVFRDPPSATADDGATQQRPCCSRRPWAVKLHGDARFERGALACVVVHAVLTVLGMALLSSTSSLVTAVDATFLVVFSLELYVRFAALGCCHALQTDGWVRLDLLVVVLGWLGVLTSTALSAFGDSIPHITAIRAVRLLKLTRATRVARIVGVSHRLRATMRSLRHVRNMLKAVLTVMSSVVFCYAVLGVALFKDTLTYTNEQCAPWCPRFTSVGRGVLAMWQLTLGGNWGVPMRSAMAAHESYLPVIFFVSFTLLVPVLAHSLLRALVMRIYTAEISTVRQEVQPSAQERLKLLFPVESTKWNRCQARLQVALSVSVRKRFNRYDVDGSGTISARELKWLLEDVGDTVTDEAGVQRAMRHIVGPRTKEITWDDFILWWRERVVHTVFERYDADGSGQLSPNELPSLFRALGVSREEAESKELIAQAMQLLDPNKDGFISLPEFTKYFVEVFDVEYTFNKVRDDPRGITPAGFEKLTRTLGASKLTLAERAAAFHKLDASGNGIITFEEYLPWWNSRLAFARQRKRLMLSQHSHGAEGWEDELLKDAMQSMGVVDDTDGSGSDSGAERDAAADGAVASAAHGRGGSTGRPRPKSGASRPCAVAIASSAPLQRLLLQLDVMARQASRKVVAGDALGAFDDLRQLQGVIEAAGVGDLRAALQQSLGPQALQPPVLAPDTPTAGPDDRRRRTLPSERSARYSLPPLMATTVASAQLHRVASDG